jgi:adenosylmethionine-8-amino-7-oxononanoate aminotransferase
MSGAAEQPFWERDQAYCWHPYTQHGLAGDVLPVVAAEGAWLTLASGARVLDGISSWWSCLHGHGRPELVEAIRAQASQLDHVLFAGCTHEPAVDLAEALAQVAPAGLTRTFFSDDGSTAVEVALKACYQAAARRGEGTRTRFLALEGGYHGDTFGAMAASDPDPFFRHFEGLLCEVERIPASVEALRDVLAARGETFAALIVEPIVQGAAGMRAVPPAFLAAARRETEAAGVALIADEVMTGFGRTGTLFACEQAGIVPDALCLSKGLTGGMLPMAVTLFPERLFEAFRSTSKSDMLFHGHTYTANPIGCALALASLQLTEAEAVPARFAQIGTWIRAGLEASDLDTEHLNVRSFGGIVALDLPVAEAGYLCSAGARLQAAVRRESPDVLLRPLGSVLYAMPPACTSEEECALIARRMAAVLRAALRDG